MDILLGVLAGIAVCIGTLLGMSPNGARCGSDALATKIEHPAGATAVACDSDLPSAFVIESSTETPRAGTSQGAPYVAFFPNPVREAVTFLARGICWCSVRGLRVTLFDEGGQCVLQEETSAATFEVVGTSELPNGLYVGAFEISIGGTWTHGGHGILAILH